MIYFTKHVVIKQWMKPRKLGHNIVFNSKFVKSA